MRIFFNLFFTDYFCLQHHGTQYGCIERRYGKTRYGCTERSHGKFNFPAACPVVEMVPDKAEFFRSHDEDIAVYPSKLIPKEFSGCQYVWIGNADEPRTMLPMMAAYFNDSHAQWLVGRDPYEPVSFKCVYRNQKLSLEESENTEKCPSAASLEHRR